jgi:hypothetical protein
VTGIKILVQYLKGEYQKGKGVNLNREQQNKKNKKRTVVKIYKTKLVYSIKLIKICNFYCERSSIFFMYNGKQNGNYRLVSIIPI